MRLITRLDNEAVDSRITTASRVGDVTVSGDDVVSGKPSPDFVGIYSFSHTVADGNGNTVAPYPRTQLWLSSRRSVAVGSNGLWAIPFIVLVLARRSRISG